MNRATYIAFIIVPLILSAVCAGAQQRTEPKTDTIPPKIQPTIQRGAVQAVVLADTGQRAAALRPNDKMDLVDVGRSWLKGGKYKRFDTIPQQTGKLHISALPVAGYTLQTGFAGVLSANFAFYTNHEVPDQATPPVGHHQSDPGVENSQPASSGKQASAGHSAKQIPPNLSTVLTSVTYSQYSQIIFPIQADIWTKGNKYNIVTDWRYLKYPSLTYGLGGNTVTDSGYNIDYTYLRLHQAILKRVATDFYLGLGYDFDYFWNVREIDPPTGKPTDFERYGLHNTEIASGISAHFLYDSRRNQINPENGDYVSIAYRPNFTFLGSDANWQSLIVDLRKYILLPGKAHNVIAIWSYDWLTTGGAPPYLLLPSTGWDAYSNTARGYIQGRFRSRNMLYLESEYRFGITNNGLIGGVAFVNAQSFSEPGNPAISGSGPGFGATSGLGHFQYILPGYGGGIRISLNKFSRTNLCIDYGIGKNGSGGFFVNLGEVF